MVGTLKAGAGRMEIVDAVDSQRIVTDLRFAQAAGVHGSVLSASPPTDAG